MNTVAFGCCRNMCRMGQAISAGDNAAVATWYSSGSAGGVGVAPDPLERQPPGMGRDQLMDRFRPPISGGIKPDRRRRLEQRHRHLPKPLDALGGREQRMVAAHRVEDQ